MLNRTTPLNRHTLRTTLAATALGLVTATAGGAASVAQAQTTDPETAPPHISDDSVLGWDSLGPATLGDDADTLVDLGVVAQGTGTCSPWGASDAVPDGIELDRYDAEDDLTEIALTRPATNATVDGARPGMTVAEVREVYGDDFQVVTKRTSAGESVMGSVRQGDKELLFTNAQQWHQYTDTLPDDAVVDSIILREYSPERFADC